MERMFEITQEQFDNVKHVLFGNQKQANVINEAVVKIVARGLLEISSSTACDSEDAVVTTLTNYFQTLIDNNQMGNETLVLLTAGEQSLENLRNVGPKVVNVEQPNPESPKFNFRVYMLGEVPDIDRTVTTTTEQPEIKPLRETGNAPYVYSEDNPLYDPTDDFPTRVKKITDAILPLVPDAVKRELSDPTAQALCCAEYFYRNNA